MPDIISAGVTAPASATTSGTIQLTRILRGTNVAPRLNADRGFKFSRVYPNSAGGQTSEGVGWVIGGAPTQTNQIDSDGQGQLWTTAAVAGSQAVISLNATVSGIVRGTELFSYGKFKTSADLTSQRIWGGLTDTGGGWANSDNPNTSNTMAFRYSSVVGANWFIYTSNGASSTATDYTVAVTANTLYQYVITTPIGGGNPSFSLYDNTDTLLGSTLTATLTLPATSTIFTPAGTDLRALIASARSIGWYYSMIGWQ